MVRMRAHVRRARTCTKAPAVLKNSRKIATKSHTCGLRIPRDRARSGPTGTRARAGTRVSAPHEWVHSPPRCGNMHRRGRVAPSHVAPTQRRPRRRRVRARNAVRHYVRGGAVTLGLRRIDRAGVWPTSEATHWALRNSDRGGRAPTKFNASFAVGASWVVSERVQNAEWRVESERLASFFARVSRRPRARRHSVAPRARRGARRAARGRGRAGGARGGGDGRPAQGRPRARARARALGWALWLG